MSSKAKQSAKRKPSTPQNSPSKSTKKHASSPAKSPVTGQRNLEFFFANQRQRQLELEQEAYGDSFRDGEEEVQGSKKLGRDDIAGSEEGTMLTREADWPNDGVTETSIAPDKDNPFLVSQKLSGSNDTTLSSVINAQIPPAVSSFDNQSANIASISSSSSTSLTLASTTTSLSNSPTQLLTTDIHLFDPSLFPTSTLWPHPTIPPYSHLVTAFTLISGTTSRTAILNILTNVFRVLLAHSPDDLLPSIWLCFNAISPPHIGLELGVGPQILTKTITGVSDPLRKARRLGRRGLRCQGLGPHTRGAQASNHSRRVRFAARDRRSQGPRSRGGEGRARDAIAARSAGRGGAIPNTDACTAFKDRGHEDDGVSSAGTGVRHDDAERMHGGGAGRSIGEKRGGGEGGDGGKNEKGGGETERVLCAVSGLGRDRAVVGQVRGCGEGSGGVSINRWWVRFCLRSWLKFFYFIYFNYSLYLIELCWCGRGRCSTPPDARQDHARSIRSFHHSRGSGTHVRIQIRWTAQIHLDSTGKVKIFSRHLEDITEKYPDVVALIPQIIAPDVTSFVMDAEVVAVDEQGRLQSFQVLSNRARKNVEIGRISVQVVNLMYLNSSPLLTQPLRQRRSLLRSQFHEVDTRFRLVQHIDAAGSIESQDEVHAFFRDSLVCGCEGIMVKVLDHATENNGADDGEKERKEKEIEGGKGNEKEGNRNGRISVSKAGSRYGNGRKAGWYSPILLALYNPENETYESVCKCMSGEPDEKVILPPPKGFSDAFYKELLELYTRENGRIIDRPKSYYVVDERALHPDGMHFFLDILLSTSQHYSTLPYLTNSSYTIVWFEPWQVWEIKGADITLSPVHKASVGLVDESRGLSLRFPRFVRQRDDKTPEDATTSTQMAEMFAMQRRKGDEGGVEEES
ncbi:hypothetical protein BC937DRAFT_88299 [Endogone sp. FLAS-F59071]|nr:hypothetical protein BC937DRAFT_88299 [Endogone sp. FLAS-F59071]|eukprot:RUS18825.1 hypothetical protein BC937DRAFT_88299 [Endogone sp. FLAS-F59071]